jgi:hypothetical protein
MDYFRKLPIVHYNDMFARNLLTRVQFTKESFDNRTIFYPYTLKQEDRRLDIVSDKYYDNSDYAWLIMMTNNIIDPYYGPGVTLDELDELVKAKYGSIGEAQATILYWRNDWIADDSTITTAAYDNLQSGLKKYWTHVLNYDGLVIGYERKKEDWLTSTNKLVECTVTANTAFDQDARVRIGSTIAVVAFSNTTVITLKHVQGVIANNTSIVSNTVTQTITAITQINYSIPAVEETYWTPIDAYTDLQETNQKARDIKLLDNRLKYDVEKEIERLIDNT